MESVLEMLYTAGVCQPLGRIPDYEAYTQAEAELKFVNAIFGESEE